MSDHEKPDVYKISMEFMAIAVNIADSIHRGSSSLAGQLKRTAWSTPPDIADGRGKNRIGDKKTIPFHRHRFCDETYCC